MITFCFFFGYYTEASIFVFFFCIDDYYVRCSDDPNVRYVPVANCVRFRFYLCNVTRTRNSSLCTVVNNLKIATAINQ